MKSGAYKVTTQSIMPVYQTTKSVRHSADKMLKLVSDVERYPEFVPLCRSLTVHSRTREGNQEVLVADMTVAYKLINETFTSHVTIDHEKYSIVARYIDGPFRELENIWSFEDMPEGCKINFYIDYEFRSRALQLLMGTVFDKAIRKFTHAFEERAYVVFGPPST